MALLALANAQFGVLHDGQLTRRGLTRGAIDQRVGAGRLTRLHDGVFAWGHSALTREGRWLAAQWACGPGATLTHWTAGAASGMGAEPAAPAHVLAPSLPAQPVVHVSTTRSIASRPGIVVHRVKQLDPADVQRRGLLRLTRVPRTLVDLADVTGYGELRGAVDTLRWFSPGALRGAQSRAPNRPGRGLITRLLEADEAHTKSALERRYLRFLRSRDLPRPDRLNAWVAGHKADCVYDGPRLVVELDGRAYHERRAQLDADHRRDEAYQLSGHRILRLLWDDLHPANAAATKERLRAMLDRRVPQSLR